MMKLLKRFVRERAGQDLIECALIAGFICLFAHATIAAVGQSIHSEYDIDTRLHNLSAGS
jgi:Flp pilus assembly pilin Flp